MLVIYDNTVYVFYISFPNIGRIALAFHQETAYLTKIGIYQLFWMLFNFLPNDEILDQSKLKEFSDNKINLTLKLKFIFGWVENIVGKGENAGY